MKKYFLILIILILGIFVWYNSNDEIEANEKTVKTDLPIKFTNSTYCKNFNLLDKFVIYVDFIKPRKFPINGLESSNDNALNRGIVIHTSHYVSERGCRGNSDGCFVVTPEVFELIQMKRYLLLNKCYLLALN
ncbi:MAG: murein L,D-transpeptidase catalytic domain-containing protein [Bacteroidota bacterium]